MSMDKEAFYRYAGRDLGLRAKTDDLVDQAQSKTASFGEDEIAGIQDQVLGLTYVDELQKIAENRGVARGINAVLETIGDMQEPTVEKVAAAAEDAFDAVISGAFAPQAETEKEAQTLQDEMVYGCAEAIGALHGVDPSSDQVMKVAVNLVAQELDANE
jgi:hypothetical protein